MEQLTPSATATVVNGGIAVNGGGAVTSSDDEEEDEDAAAADVTLDRTPTPTYPDHVKQAYVAILYILSAFQLAQFIAVRRWTSMTRVIQGITQFYLPPKTSHTCLYSPASEHHRLLFGRYSLRLPTEG